MATVLQELTGNGRGQQVMAATMVVALTTVLTTGMNFWWTREADDKLMALRTEAREARAYLASELRRDIQNAAERLQDRAKVLEDRLSRMEAVDSAIQALVTQELRSLREDIGTRLTIDEKNEIVQRRNEEIRELSRRMRDIEDRNRQLEQAVYGRRP